MFSGFQSVTVPEVPIIHEFFPIEECIRSHGFRFGSKPGIHEFGACGNE
jgi:hypothetical protein